MDKTNQHIEKTITWTDDHGTPCRGIAVQLIPGRSARYVVRPVSGVEHTCRALLVRQDEATVVKTTRRDRGVVVYLKNGVAPLGEVGFLVQSQSDPGKTYLLTGDGCTCLDAKAGNKCKHQYAVEVWKERNET